MCTLELAKAEIRKNLKEDNTLTVKSKRTKKEYIIAQQYPTDDGWFVYEGCELVVGDVTFDYAVSVLLIETR